MADDDIEGLSRSIFVERHDRQWSSKCRRRLLPTGTSLNLDVPIPVELLVGNGRKRNGQVAFPLHIVDDESMISIMIACLRLETEWKVDRKQNVVCLDALYKTTCS